MSISILNAGASGGAPEQFGVMNALNQGGFISWTVAGILTIMLFFSLYILFTKLFEQQKIMNQARRVRASFWNSNSLREGAAKLEKNSAYKQLVDDGLAAQEQHSRLTDPVEAHDWLHGSLRRSEDVINSQLGGGLAFLATVGATAPFIGLFGTVLGIYRALINIGQAGQASIDKVAGPVGEALIMTAFGLVVAVPAVLAYNWLQRRNKAIAEDLSRVLERRAGLSRVERRGEAVARRARRRPLRRPAGDADHDRRPPRPARPAACQVKQ